MNFKRFLAFVLAMVMVFGYLPAGASATPADGVIDTAAELVAAVEAGGDIVLGGSVELDAPLTVNGTVLLDLNGYTLSYDSTVMGEAMITNKGDLTIDDSSDEKSGVINYNYIGEADSTYGKGNYTISNGGKLTVNGGKITIANLRGHAKYPINNNSTTGNAELIINGGHLYNYNTSAIRQFCNSESYKNTVTVNGGVIEGYCAIWMQNPGSKTVHGELTITGGEIKTTAAAYVNGTAALEDVASAINCTTEGGEWSGDSAVSITGGIINENVYLAENAPAAITIGKDATFNGSVAVPGQEEPDGVIDTAAELIAAVEAGGKVVLGGNIVLTEPLVIGENQDVTLDLNGYAVSGERTEKLTVNDALIRITKGGKLTVTDSGENGSITYGYTGDSTGWGGYSASTIENNQGTLIIEGGKIVSTTTVANQIAYAVNSLTNGNIGDAYVTIKGGEIESAGSTAVRQFANSTTCTNTLVIEGGKITGRVQLQSSSKNDNKGVLTITGGEIIREGNTAIEVWFSGGSDSAFAATNVSIGGDVEVTGNVVFDEAPAGYNTKVISGGTFTADVTAYLTDGLVQGEDGKVVAAPDVEAPALPTATVTRKFLEDLTFAMNFKADEVTAEQLACYGNWYADFVLTVNKDVTFNANGGADGYLSGQYDAWSEKWISVPFEDVKLNANEPLKIMEYAAGLMSEPGLKVTYKDIVTTVKDFDCGVFFEPEFLAANPDLEVTLELRMYNPANESESYTVGNPYTYTQEDIQPAMPNAIVSKIEHDKLTFALNFKTDNATLEQLTYYGNWYADFELTINKDVTFNAEGGADGYLSGQYDDWSENWISVPFENVTLEAGKPLKIMEYAAKALGKPGLKVTCAEVYDTIKDFDCGVYFTDEFLAANPDLEVKLELRMYNPVGEKEGYTLGEAYIFNLLPELPDAEVEEVENANLTFAASFDAAKEATEEQVEYYGNWYADFELVLNRDVIFNANGSRDGYVSCQYMGGDWVNVPTEDLAIKAGKPVKIMDLLGMTGSAQTMTLGEVMELMGASGDDGWELTYGELVNEVQTFNCGVYFTEEFLEENPGLNATVELKIYNPANENEKHTVGNSYTYVPETEYVAKNVEKDVSYSNVSEALEAAASGETVILLKDAEDVIVTVLENTTLDLNGYKLGAQYVACFGDIIDSDAKNAGRLDVDAKRFLIQEQNAQLPVNTAEGYLFAEIVKFNEAMQTPTVYAFQPVFESYAVDALKEGKLNSGVTVEVQISWAANDGTRSQYFEYNDGYVEGFLNSYKPSTGKFGQMFTLTFSGAENLENLQFQVVVRSESGVVFRSNGIYKNATETTKEEILTAADGSSAVVPKGVQLEKGAKLKLTTTEMDSTGGSIMADDGETMRSINVHVDGLSENNQVPITVTLSAAAPDGLNEGNLKLYHVENGESILMTRVFTLAEVDAHNEYYYDIATGTITMALKSFSEFTMLSEDDKAWKGNYDYSWYTPDAKDMTIANADQLAAFGALVGGMAKGLDQDSFSGKTVKLVADINLGDKESENDPDIIFYPIGYWNNEGTYERKPVEERTTAVESGFYTFEGTFDGNGHTISNFYQNTWEMKGDHNWYDPIKEQYYRDGMGLFGRVYGGTVKNLTVRNFSSDGEIATTGVIAAYADGATFENIAIFNCNPRVYNIGNGGIVGCVGWYAKEANLKTTFKNITVDNSNKISALWGSWDVACGGLVGQYYPTSGQSSYDYPENAGIHMDNCHVSAQIDVYNDVCANYQYYAYRYAGMLIGSVRENVTIDGREYPKMDGITASGCTVHFGTWNDYYYCEIIDNTTASYTHDYQMSRLEQVTSVDTENMKIVTLKGEEQAIPTDGRVNYVVVDGEHATENATCYHFKDGKVWNHEAGGKETVNGVEVLKEDKQHIYLEFNNLVTGYGWGVTSRGLTNLEGVTNLDVVHTDNEDSVEKFAKAQTAKETYEAGTTVTIGDLFVAIANSGVDIKGDQVQVAVSPVGEESTAGGTYDANIDDWTQGTLTFTGEGAATITITDYYFCAPTTINVTIQGSGSNDNELDWS